MPTPNQAALQTQYAQIQQLQQSGEEEINRMLAPVQLSRAYVEEQVNDQLQKAVDQAVVKRKLTMVLRADAIVYADPAYNMNQAVLDEINVAARAPLGIALQLRKTPLEFYGEIAFKLVFVDDDGRDDETFDLDGGLGFRIYF